MASATTADQATSTRLSTHVESRAGPFGSPQDAYNAPFWSTPHMQSPSITMTTPPRQAPVAVTPTSSTGNISMASASGGFSTSRAGIVRVRQQLAPRQLDFKHDERRVEHHPVSPVTPPRVSTTHVAAPVTPPPPLQYYAVARGRRVGVYTTIAEVYEEIAGYDYHVYRLCATRQEAERFIDRYFDVTQGRRGDPDPRHKSTLVAFCDGATQGKRNWSHQTGVACIFPHNSSWDMIYTCLDAYCTAYRATAKAALAAINRANKENPAQDQVLYIYTRNQLLVRAMTEWMEKWLQNDWRKGDGHPVKNRDVLQNIVEAQGVRRVIWRLEDHWTSEWTASVVSAAEDASVDVGELLDAACM